MMGAGLLLMLALATAVNSVLIQPLSASGKPAPQDVVTTDDGSMSEKQLETRRRLLLLLRLLSQQPDDAAPALTSSEDELAKDDVKTETALLNKLLYDLGVDYTSNRKRTCRFNLGGHCATEEAVSMANQWHFLNSPLSPGRRRRNVVQLTGLSDTDARSRSLQLDGESRPHPGEQVNST